MAQKETFKMLFFFFPLEQEVPMVYELFLKGGEKNLLGMYMGMPEMSLRY